MMPEEIEFSPDDRRRVFWWEPTRRFWRKKRTNVGDLLGPVVVDAIARTRNLRIGGIRPGARRLLTIGSVLHFANDGDVIWGTGVNGKIAAHKHRFRTLDVRAVRGPRTRAFLLERGIPCPEIYGDPGLLVPDLFPRASLPEQPHRDLVFVPHLHDTVQQRLPKEVHVLLPTAPWPEFVSTLAHAGRVISSSLHGIIVAEAFGVPAQYFRQTHTEHLFKFFDYYEGTGRERFHVADSFEEAMRAPGEAPMSFDREALLGAFPWDLWGSPER